MAAIVVVVCGHVPWLYQYWPGGFMLLWFYVQELPKAQPAVDIHSTLNWPIVKSEKLKIEYFGFDI